ERLGFLPGDLMAKVDPYLRPLFDALHDMLEADRVTQHLERGVIEVAPLAFMRGRSLNSSFIILDEAQNTSPEQMKMFLTRLGFNSKMVVTGDITQIDLPREQDSGLVVVADILKDVEGIDFVRFGEEDVVRHKLVRKIVEATDVLSFGVDENGRAAGPRELGDIVICPECTPNVREAILHGALHLSGMDHETDEGEMLALQAELMRWVE